MKKCNIFLRFVYLGAVIVLGLNPFLGITGCNNGGGDSPPPPPPKYTVSGTIQTSDSVMIDGDVNDPFAPYAPNDDFTTAQRLSNPVTIGGYVNVAGSGEPGRSSFGGDPSDYYQATLAAGQAITLLVAEHPTANLDLFLYNTSQAQVASSETLSGTESLTIAANDTYFIEVKAVSGASNYNLAIGQTTLTAGKSILSLSHDFVPGEVIVRFKNDRALSKSLQSAESRAASVGMRAKSGAAEREMLLSFDDENGKQRAFRTLGIKAQELTRQTVDPLIQRKLDTLQIIKALRQRSDVLIAEPNYIWRATATPDDPLYSTQWHYPLINLPQAWDIETGSNTVIVAVIDTGVLLNHPELMGRLDNILAPGYDFIKETSISVDGDGIDPNPDDPGDQDPGGSSFHGTHVAGTIAAETDNATGVAGVTWNTLIMPLRALGKGGGTVYDVMQSVRYAAGMANDSGTTPPSNADIINLSLGGGGFSQTAQDVFTLARNAGVIIIAAAGNESSSTPGYPAAYAGVVSVGAVDINKALAWYSNFGATVDLVAPGGDNGADINADGFPDGVLSTCGNDTSSSIGFVYCFYQGTSMAAPHMAGVVALMKAINPGLSPADLDTLIMSGNITEDLGIAGRDDQFGYGLIDAFKAIEESSGGPLPATLIVTPTSLNFGTALADTTLTVENGGDNLTNVTVTETPDEPWLTVVASSVDADGLGDYTVSVDRSGLADGIYSARITVDATVTVPGDVTDVIIPVIMQKDSFPVVGGDAGFHYVILVNPDTLAPLYQDEMAYDGSKYSYSFPNVPAGSYKIYAGTDSDNDFDIGDPGEASGAYQTWDQPTVVNITGNTSGLDFATSFELALPSHLMAGRPVLQRLKLKGASQ